MFNEQHEYTGLKYRLFTDDFAKLPQDMGIAKPMSLSGSTSGAIFLPQNLEGADEILLCEGEIDGLSLASLGFKPVLINLGGVNNCRSIIKKLCKERTVYSLYDAELFMIFLETCFSFSRKFVIMHGINLIYALYRQTTTRAFKRRGAKRYG